MRKTKRLDEAASANHIARTPRGGGGPRSEETEIQGGMANNLGVRDGVKARTCLAMLRQRAERLADAVVPHAAAPTAEDASGCV